MSGSGGHAGVTKNCGRCGYHFRCRECAARSDRADHLARTCGLTSEDVSAMLDAQDGHCAISAVSPAAQVDHDHATGDVRGMLCFSCNAALGHFRDDPAVLRRAAICIERTGTSATNGEQRRMTRVAQLFSTGRESVLEDAARARLADARHGTAS